ncbi:MAG: hypothetical protein ACJAZM_001941 [Cyclobacteriaceae bacterium]|jgi:hypothetical protein
MAYYSYVWKLDEQTRTKYLASNTIKDSLNQGAAPDPMMRYYDYVSDVIQPREQVRRTKYGIVKYEPMWLKNYNLKSAPKENVLGPKQDPKENFLPIDEGEFLLSDFGGDSLYNDSTAFAMNDSSGLLPDQAKLDLASRPKKPETKYLYRYDPDSLNNVEQEYYNKYYGELLIDYRSSQRPKVNSASNNNEQSQEEVADTASVKKKKVFGRKKSVSTDPVVGSDTTQVQQPEPIDPEGGN